MAVLESDLASVIVRELASESVRERGFPTSADGSLSSNTSSSGEIKINIDVKGLAAMQLISTRPKVHKYPEEHSGRLPTISKANELIIQNIQHMISNLASLHQER